MAQNVTLMGASYPDVPAVEFTKTGGGIATFHDVSGVNATASHVLSPKLFVGANGYEQGSMPNNGAISGAISDKDTPVSIPAGYTSGGSVGLSAAEKNKLIAGNIKEDVTLFGQPGSLKDWTTFPLALQTIVRHDFTIGSADTKTFNIPATDLGGKTIKFIHLIALTEEGNTSFSISSSVTTNVHVFSISYDPYGVLYYKGQDPTAATHWYAYMIGLIINRSNNRCYLNHYRRQDDAKYSLVNENQLSTGGAKIVIDSSLTTEFFRKGTTYRIVIGG